MVFSAVIVGVHVIHINCLMVLVEYNNSKPLRLRKLLIQLICANGAKIMPQREGLSFGQMGHTNKYDLNQQA